MEILGGGPGNEDELRSDRDERGGKTDGQGAAGQRRRRVAASLDLGTMDLAPGIPAAYGRPPAPQPTGTASPVPHAAPAAVPARPGDARPVSDDEVWMAVRASTPGTSAGTTPAPASGPVAGRATMSGTAPAGYPGDVLNGGADDADDAWHDGEPDADHALHERDYRIDLVAAVFSSPSLALAGLAITLAGLTGGAGMMVLYAELSSAPPDAVPKLIAKALGAVGLVSAVLAFTSLRRMRATTPRWVATVAGATILIAVFLLCAAGYFWWSASGIPAETSIE